MADAKAPSVLVFGDQSVPCHSFLKEILLRARDSPLCGSFLRQVNNALRDEIANLPPESRKQIPSFSTIQELNLRYQDTEQSHVGLDGALLSVTQLAHYITASEAGSWTGQEPTILTGFCTGGLAAAAVACSPAPGSIVPIACEAVKIAFRIGCLVQQTSQLLYGSENAEAWAFLVPEVSQTECSRILSSFNSANNITALHAAYISASSANAVTISGPPSTLKLLFADDSGLGMNKRIPLAIHAPYHAAHIHSKSSVASILAASRQSSCLDELRPQHILLSAQSGRQIQAETARDLFAQIVFEILCEPLALESVLDACSELITTPKQDAVHVSGLGPVNIVNSMITSLRQKTGKAVDQGFHARWFALAKIPRNLSSRQASKPKLAIVGMAGRFPSSGDHNKFWDLLMAGIDAHRPVPPDRFDSKLYFDPTGKIRNTSHTPYGNFINEPGMFDPRFFNLSPREAAQTCPMQRLALVTAYEALEMAGYVPNRTAATQLERIGTYYGQTSDDWREINAAQDVDTYYITGGVRAFGPGRINYTFKFSGPSFNVDTACSSSMAAIQIACTALQAGECDTAVAGGVSVLTNPDIFAGLSRGQFLSKTGNCQTFDNDADGYCRADGIGTIVLKRLEDAEADNDNILAVILGTATNHSAEAISITHPHDKAQEFLYSKILDEAGIDALDVDYVEMHGTGTQAGDDTEMRSVSNVFAPSKRKRKADQPLFLGSVKANVGHGEAASGVTALIKCLMMLERNKVPPHIGIKTTMNVNFPKDLAERGVNIALGGPRDFLPRPDRGRIVYVNNFSAAGGNTGLLLEERPRRKTLEADPRCAHIIAVSAKSKPSLKVNIERLLTWLGQNPAIRLEDLSYTLTARRMHHNYRFAVPVTSIDQARTELEAALEKQISPIQNTKPKVGFLYTGQGVVYAALGRDAFQHEPKFRNDILTFDDMAQSLGFPSFLPVVDGSMLEISTASTTVTQLALTCTQIAFTRLWRAWGVEPDFVMGHSLGEYAALHAAGVLSAIDAIYLVGSRAQLLDRYCVPGSHAMLSVRAQKSVVEILPAELNERLAISCLNAPQETVLGGIAEDIALAMEYLNSKGIKCMKLELPFAFHTQQVDPILEPFQELAKSVHFSEPKVPFLSTLTGERYVGAISPQYLARHARESVRFSEVLQTSRASGMIDDSTLFVEIGPHPVCLHMVKSTLGSSYLSGATLRRNEDFHKTASATACMLHIRGVPVAWNEFHHGFRDNLRLLVLPAYAFDEKNYWIQYAGDWCLNKNTPHPLINGSDGIKAVETKSPIATTTIHKVVEEKLENDHLTLVTETDLSREDTAIMASGHKVNGITLISSCALADMAVTVGNYIERKHRKSAKTLKVNVSNMAVHRSVICEPTTTTPHILLCSVKSDLKTQQAVCTFTSSKGKTSIEHGHCTIQYGDPEEWKAEWQRISYLIQGRIKVLQSGLATGDVQLIRKRMAYKLFGALVEYSDAYCGMEEIHLNSDDFEATARVKLVATPDGMSFDLNPCWIDSTCHITGFIVNASDAVDSSKTVYISHGWDSMRFAEELSVDKTYRSYVRMQPTGQGKMMAGDVYIFDTETNTIVAASGGVKFQGVPRSLLNQMLPPVGAAAKVKASATASPTAIIKTRVQEIKTVTKTETIASATTPPASILGRTLEIIAEEMGIGVDELDDPINFSEMGCDSLMSLSITGRMREEMDVDVESHIFVDYPTVGQLKAWIKENFDTSSGEGGSSDDTPASRSSSGSDTLGSGPASPSTPASTHDIDGARQITTLDLKKHLNDLKTGVSTVSVESVRSTPPQDRIVSIPSHPARVATSVILQGSPRRATKSLWMMPDGGGSATSYMSIPKLADHIVVYGLNSPYMKTPEEYNQGLVEITTKFVIEMRRKQPKGPYTLAGWSAGGVVAFEACQQLTAQGEVVEKLLLLDAPCPLIIEPLPATLHQFFNEIGLLGDGLRDAAKIPPWLLPHFAASVAALSTYAAAKLPVGKSPKTLALWCTDGVCKHPEDRRPDPYPYGHAQWLLENRSDFGPNLWDRFIDAENMEMVTVPGNHFTMMRSPNVELMGDRISDFMLS